MHCATLIFVSVVFYPIMDDLKTVIPSVEHITKETTLMKIMNRAINDYNITDLVNKQIQSVVLDIEKKINNSFTFEINELEKDFNNSFESKINKLEHGLNNSFTLISDQLNSTNELLKHNVIATPT